MSFQRWIAPLGLAALSLTLPMAPAWAGTSDPSSVSAGDQYVETIPGGTGNKVTGVEQVQDEPKSRSGSDDVSRISLKPSVAAGLKSDGAASSKLLAAVAESPRFAAPRAVLPSVRHESENTSRGFVPAALSALSSGHDGLGWLIAALAAVGLIALVLLFGNRFTRGTNG